MQFDLTRVEGQFVEFKESLDKSLSKELVAFANALGGIIEFSVEYLRESVTVR